MLRIDGASLTVEDVAAVARTGTRVGLAPAARKRMERSKRAADRAVRREPLVYGIKTGFGQLESVEVSPGDAVALQYNLVRSHAAGVGPPLSREQVRAAMLVRANSLAKGFSGVRPALAQRLLDLLNRGVHPVVPSRGSLGASGDLAPLAHIALVLIGEGRAEYGGRTYRGGLALRKAGVAPLRLKAKEGLALINGTSVMTGLACLAVHDAQALLRDAQVAASMSFEALLGSVTPFDARFEKAKGLPGPAAVAANLRRLLRGSEIGPTHAGPYKVQDAYTLRCIPQVLGACAQSIAYASEVADVEANAATDNPLVFPPASVLSGGTFHGQGLAMALDFLSLAMCVLAGFSERRVARLVDTHLSGLPPFLTEGSGLRSGMMVAQYTAAALASEAKVLAHPASADSLTTSAGQEDWVPMGQAAALKATDALGLARHAVSIEYAVAAQALEFLRPLRPGLGPRAAHRAIRRRVEPLDADRPLAPDFEAIHEMMVAGRLVAAARKASGAFPDA